MISGRRYSVQSGRKVMELRWSNAQEEAALQMQKLQSARLV